MKNLLKLILCALIIIGLFGCGESKPKCEHANTTTKYEISGLSIKKSVTCNDCEKEVSKGTVSKLQYVYDKVLVDEGGIKVTLLNVEVDGWATVTMNVEVEGTSDSKRTFNVEKTFLNGYDEAMFVYASDLSGNKKSLDSEWINGIKGEDFLAEQNYEVEMDYKILDSDSYHEISSGEVKFNLNEYTSVKEIEK